MGRDILFVKRPIVDKPEEKNRWKEKWGYVGKLSKKRSKRSIVPFTAWVVVNSQNDDVGNGDYERKKTK